MIAQLDWSELSPGKGGGDAPFSRFGEKYLEIFLRNKGLKFIHERCRSCSGCSRLFRTAFSNSLTRMVPIKRLPSEGSGGNRMKKPEYTLAELPSFWVEMPRQIEAERATVPSAGGAEA